MGSHGLRVLVIGINFAPEETGIAPYTTGLVRGLSARGHDVSVLSTHPHYPQWRIADGYGQWTRTEQIEGVSVTRVRHYVPDRPTGVFRALSEVSFGMRATAREWGRPDVVVCVSPALLSTAMAAGRASGGRHRPAVGVILQDLYSAGVAEQGGSARLARVFRRVESGVARRADGVAVIHQRFKDRVVDDLGVSEDRVTVVRNWTHLPPAGVVDRVAMRRSLGWHEQETVVLHSGAMGQKQDLANVVEAARRAEHRGETIRFVLMGDGGQRRDLERLGHGLRNLQFIDPLPGSSYGQALRSADVLLVNEKEGLEEMAVPSKLTSYFSTGLPVLAAAGANSTTADEVRASGAGVLVQAGDPDALIAGARELGHDRARAADIGARGPDYCDRVLSENAALDSYDDWIRVLHGRRNTREG